MTEESSAEVKLKSSIADFKNRKKLSTTFFDIHSIEPKSPAEGVEMRIIPGDVVHSGKTQDAPTEVIEAFSPAREDLARN